MVLNYQCNFVLFATLLTLVLHEFSTLRKYESQNYSDDNFYFKKPQVTFCE